MGYKTYQGYKILAQILTGFETGLVVFDANSRRGLKNSLLILTFRRGLKSTLKLSQGSKSDLKLSRGLKSALS